MEITKGFKPQPGEEQARIQATERDTERYLTLIRDLRAQEHDTTSAMDASLRHCLAMAEEYQAIMRTITRPGGNA